MVSRVLLDVLQEKRTMTLHSHPVHSAFTTNAVRQAMRIAGPNQKATVPSPDFGNLLARAAAAESTALPNNSNSPIAQPTASAPQSAQPEAAAVIAAPAGPNFSTATVGTPAQGYVPAGKTVVAPAGLVGGAPGVTSSAFVLPSAAGLGYQDYMALVNADNPGVFGNTSPLNSARITQSQALNEAASAEYINDPLSGLHIPPGSVAV